MLPGTELSDIVLKSDGCETNRAVFLGAHHHAHAEHAHHSHHHAVNKSVKHGYPLSSDTEYVWIILQRKDFVNSFERNCLAF